MQATIANNKLTITIDLAKELVPSSTGKSLIVASSGGWTGTAAEVNGQNVSVNVTAIVKNSAYVKGQQPNVVPIVPSNGKSNGNGKVNNRLRPVVA